MNTKSWSDKEVLTFNEGCEYCGLTKDGMYYLTRRKLVPHFKPRGKMIYFLKDDLTRWLLQNRIPTIEESEREATKRAIA